MNPSNEISQDQLLLQKLKEIVLAELQNDQFGVEDLARELGMSRSHLHRKLKSLRGQSISLFIREIRLEEAMKLLQRDVGNVAEIAYRVGFSSTSYFNKCFLERYGYPPGEVGKKHQEKTSEKKVKSNNPLQSTFGKRYKWGIAALACIIISLFVFQFFSSNSTPPESSETYAGKEYAPSIAVLPFTNLSTEKENEFFADGVHDDLLSQISRISEMKVISRTSVLRFRDTEEAVQQIAKQLAVNHILEGTVRRYGNMMRLNVQLIDARTDEHLWTEKYDRELNTQNVLDIQTELAQKIAQSLEAVISPVEKQALMTLPTASIEAYEAFLKGKLQLEVRSPEALLQARHHFEKAISLDSAFALAYTYLGETHYLLTLPVYGEENSDYHIPIAKKYIEKALALHHDLAEAYAIRGRINSQDTDKLEEGLADLEKAISLKPNYAIAYLYYASVTRHHLRDFQKAYSYQEKAYSLNPMSSLIIALHGSFFVDQGDYHRAMEMARKGIEIEPANSLVWKLFTYAPKMCFGHFDSAAIYCYQTMPKVGARGIYLDYLLWALEDLRMQREVDSLLHQLQLENCKDSLIYFHGKRILAQMKNDFGQAKYYNEQFCGMNKRSTTFPLYLTYLQKDYQEVIQLFEERYPDMESWEHIFPVAYKGLRMQEYLFSLQQTNQGEKASRLWAKWGPSLLNKPPDKDEYTWEKRSRKMIQARHALLQGEVEKAFQMIEGIFEGGYWDDWWEILEDPIFDAYREHPSYLRVIGGMEAKVAEQRHNVRMYLASQSK